MVLYHDVFDVGYQRIAKMVELDFHPNDKSLIHNALKIWFLLKEWAKTKIMLAGKKCMVVVDYLNADCGL